MGLKTKIIGIVTSVILLAVLGFFFFRYYFVFGEGVKAGELNQVMYKGYVFKTYEGRLIQAGFRGASSSKGTVTMESYVFEFSVEDKEVADSLMRCSGKSVELHYKEYLGALPWRGQQKYVVDKILSVK
ncbi:MAG: hypothetical protein SOX36_07290 [Candidatus Cryptobacteroides sp.]|nr:hypothetical protein [Bacteroidales bacterium]MDY3227457.1 hypothetical protein [Candidatus Cryptobacteroides sp.]MDY5262518.1 hypothetical protein [Candidatus Cryptobacteroides sp.]MDY5570863.1 hypothetical protein [Candidatus Cryptobacteroides sp.]